MYEANAVTFLQSVAPLELAAFFVIIAVVNNNITLLFLKYIRIPLHADVPYPLPEQITNLVPVSAACVSHQWHRTVPLEKASDASYFSLQPL